MFHVVLFEPEIPPNTGNILRLCANTGCQLHLIEPLGFELDDKRLRRAGLDYPEWENLKIHSNWASFSALEQPQTLWAFSTRGARYVQQVSFSAGDYFLFGSESKGLSDEIKQQLNSDCILRIPMRANSRSMNLSNAASVIVYEAWRQLCFSGAV